MGFGWLEIEGHVEFAVIWCDLILIGIDSLDQRIVDPHSVEAVAIGLEIDSGEMHGGMSCSCLAVEREASGHGSKSIKLRTAGSKKQRFPHCRIVSSQCRRIDLTGDERDRFDPTVMPF
jgi:hypothetical protein